MNILEEFTGRKIIMQNDVLIKKNFGRFLKDKKYYDEIEKVDKLLLLDPVLFQQKWSETIRLIKNNNEIRDELEIATLLYEKEIDKIIFCDRDIQYCRAIYIVVVRKILGADLHLV